MAAFNDVRVPVPDHCVRMSRNGSTYIYRITRSYRKNGNPTNDRKLIGKLDVETGKLIPNERYYEFFPEEKPISIPNFIRKCGTFAVCRRLAEDVGLEEIVNKAFPSCANELLTAAHYMVTGNSIMYYLNDWLDETLSFTTDALTDVTISRMFSKLDAESKSRFFRYWIKKRANKEFIAYDVTSFSTYARKIEDREYGYNRDKEKLPQINFGMYYGKESQLPLYYRTYPGSITDKTHLSYMTKDLEDIDAKGLYFVMDRGFHSEDNLKYLTDTGYRFLIALNSVKFTKQLIDENRFEIVDRIAAKMPGRMMYVRKVESNYYGFRMNVHIFYDPEKAVVNKENFFAALDRMEEELRRMEQMPSANSNYCKYFTITKGSNGFLVPERNIPAIETELSRCGFFLIAETAFNMTSEEVLDCYRKRDVIEKCFDDLKNEIDMKCLHCHRSQTADGKMFAAFIALILRSQLYMKLRPFLQENNYTMHKILIELDKIKVTQVPSKPNTLRLINPLTKFQKTILNALGMDEKIFNDLI